MKHFIIAGLFGIISPAICSAQFYYKDILNNKQQRTEMELFKIHKIRGITVNSFEEDGSASKGFFCKRSFSKNYSRSEMGTRSAISTPSLFVTEFNADGSPSGTSDSSDIAITKIKYDYDEKGRVKSILSKISSSDDDFITELKEEHIYSYDMEGKPEKMLKILNLKDTTVILFAKDEKGNISIEKDSKTGISFYYYYDEKNRLTDLARENPVSGRLLPDYVFEYDEEGRLTRMMSTEEGGSNYFIWTYSYNQKGLRAEDKIYSKERNLLGRLVYSYK